MQRVYHRSSSFLTIFLFSFLVVNHSFAQFASPSYYIISTATGHCMDVEGSSESPDAAIVELPCDGRGSQRWLFNPLGALDHEIENELSRHCIDVDGQSAASGSRLRQFDCMGGSQPSQIIKVWAGPQNDNHIAFMQFDHSGLCVDLLHATVTPEANEIQQFSCHGGPNQTWLIVPAF